MDRISDRFAAGKPLIVFTVAGYPDMETGEKAIAAAVDNELGVPFSDPMADGPVIAAASQQRAAAGVAMGDVLALAERLRRRFPAVGLILFSYMNPLHHFGYAALCREAARIGIDGILPVDLPLEERDELLKPCRENGLHMIPLVSPLTPTERIRAICEGMSGFIYCINVAGVTGARAGLPAGCTELIRRVKSCTPLPVASGFGIADPRSAAAAAECADGVIAGSGFVRALEEGVEAAGRFVRGLAEAIR